MIDSDADEKPAMVVIAEMAMTKREIREALVAHAISYIESGHFMRKFSVREETGVQQPYERRRRLERDGLREELYRFCDQHAWSAFQRKKMVERVVVLATRKIGRERDRRLRELYETNG